MSSVLFCPTQKQTVREGCPKLRRSSIKLLVANLEKNKLLAIHQPWKWWASQLWWGEVLDLGGKGFYLISPPTPSPLTIMSSASSAFSSFAFSQLFVLFLLFSLGFSEKISGMTICLAPFKAASCWTQLSVLSPLLLFWCSSCCCCFPFLSLSLSHPFLLTFYMPSSCKTVISVSSVSTTRMWTKNFTTQNPIASLCISVGINPSERLNNCRGQIR